MLDRYLIMVQRLDTGVKHLKPVTKQKKMVRY